MLESISKVETQLAQQGQFVFCFVKLISCKLAIKNSLVRTVMESLFLI